MAATVYTLGHSTLAVEAFLEILRAYQIQVLADVRRYPGSRRNPQFNSGPLSETLNEVGIRYLHLEALGGRRPADPGSVNTGWKNASFRGYADYMQTPEFDQAMDQLVEIARERTTVVLCSEAVPWRCHRSLIADALLVRGFEVVDILDVNNARPHGLTAWARVEGGRITYPETAEDNPI